MIARVIAPMQTPPRAVFGLLGLITFFTLAGCGAAETRTGPRTRSIGAARGMVATVHPRATEAGLESMRRGGNAVDAAVAAALTLGVVDGFNSGIGGGCFIVLRTERGELRAIDGRETAPALATRDMFLRDGLADPSLSQTGPLAVATPGALAAYDLASREYGRLRLADALVAAADLAERGFTLDAHYASRLAAQAEKLAKFEASRDIFLRPDGSPWGQGQILRQPDLARTYRQIASGGLDFFYRGAFARALGQWMIENGGVLRAEDLENYRLVVREPVVSDYRGYTIVGFPPPSSGGVHVAQILNILENFDLRAMYAEDPALFTHIVAQAMKLAFADRAHWLGDPAFTEVPRGLIDDGYARQLAASIDAQRVIEVESHGQPPEDGAFGLAHTTHIAAADAEGNWVAITATINTTFGSGVVVPGTGVLLNNEMDDFAAAPGTPNAFGLIGAQANAIAPGKRPLSSMSPTIVLRQGRPVLTLGAAGGPRIISQVVLALIHHLDLKTPLEQAVAAPRFHHQWRPDVLYIEGPLDQSLRAALERRGHRIEVMTSSGVTQAIGFDSDRNVFIGVCDPRVPGSAAGW